MRGDKDKDKDKNKNLKWYISGAVLTLSLLLIVGLAYSPFSPWYMWWIEDDDEAVTPTVKTTSTFTLIDYVTGEDVSEWVEITIWEPTDAADFDDDEDPYRRSNFETMETTKDAADVAVDLRDEPYYWVEIDPDDDTVYGGYNLFVASGFTTRYGAQTDDYRFILGGGNYDYNMYVYHLPYNTTINVLDREADGIDAGGTVGLDEWKISGPVALATPTENGTFTVYMDVPINATDGPHFGSAGVHDWDADNDVTDLWDWEDQRWSIDQRNFRVQAPFYDIQDDTGREFDDELEVLTNAFCVRIHFNSTINDNTSQTVTFELVERDYESYPIEVVMTSTDIYCIYYEPITWSEGMFPSFDFNITVYQGNTLRQGPGVERVSTGRLGVPSDQYALGAFTELAHAILPAV